MKLDLVGNRDIGRIFEHKIRLKKLMKTFQNVRQKCGICAPKCSNLLYKCVQNSVDIKKCIKGV